MRKLPEHLPLPSLPRSIADSWGHGDAEQFLSFHLQPGIGEKVNLASLLSQNFIFKLCFCICFSDDREDLSSLRDGSMGLKWAKWASPAVVWEWPSEFSQDGGMSRGRKSWGAWSCPWRGGSPCHRASEPRLGSKWADLCQFIAQCSRGFPGHCLHQEASLCVQIIWPERVRNLHTELLRL